MLGKAFNVIMQSEVVGKVLQHEALVETILRAVTSSLEAKDVLSAHYEQLLTQVGLVTSRQLEELHSELELFKQETEGLREQLDIAAQTTRNLRKRAEKAESELQETLATITLLQSKYEEVLAQLEDETSSSTATILPEKSSEKMKDSSTLWNSNMKKAELLKIASDLGVSVSDKLKKSELVERLRTLG